MKQATLLLLVFGGFCGTAVATTPTAEQVEFFEKKIRPVLAQHCYECHNSLKKQEGGLALDYRDALLAGGETGPAIVPGKPEGSSLIWALRHEKGLKMPSKAPKLEDAVIQDFETWIAAGAPDPRLTKPTEEELTAKIPWEQVREQRLPADLDHRLGDPRRLFGQPRAESAREYHHLHRLHSLLKNAVLGRFSRRIEIIGQLQFPLPVVSKAL